MISFVGWGYKGEKVGHRGLNPTRLGMDLQVVNVSNDDTLLKRVFRTKIHHGSPGAQ